MTRETKIGLLVGLAFIIVIGILLSDHLTSATEPQQAQLAQVAGNVRTGVAVPGAAQQQQQPPITNVAPPQDVSPQQTVLTKEELTPKQPPVEIVKIGGPANPAPTQQQQQQQQQQAPAVADAKSQAKEPPITVVDATPTPAPAPVKAIDPAKNPLARVAEAFNEELVPVGAEHQQPKSEPTKPLIAAAALPPGARHYKAGPGDSVSRLAARFLGADTKANRDAILAVNPTLQKNPNIIVLGRTYVIPAAPTASAAPAPLPDAPTTPPPVPAPIVEVNQAPTAPPAPSPVVIDPAGAQAESFYVVKPGDSLTKISVEQLGSAAGVPAIMDLNRDVLKGSDVIRPNMKLRLPAKPLAMAQ